MKRTTHKLSKMERKVRSKRKSWTNARRFEVKHERALEAQAKQMRQLKKLLAQMQAEADAKTEAEHVHTAECGHDLVVAEDVSNVPLLGTGEVAQQEQTGQTEEVV